MGGIVGVLLLLMSLISGLLGIHELVSSGFNFDQATASQLIHIFSSGILHICGVLIGAFCVYDQVENGL